MTNSYTYLGVTFQTTCCFTEHIKNVVVRATRATFSLPNPRKLSVQAGVKLFNIKIRPILTYAIEPIWPHLKAANLHTLDRAKTTFLKRMLSLPPNASNTLVLTMCHQKTLVEDLLREMNLSENMQTKQYRTEIEGKRRDIEEDFWKTPALTGDQWTGPNDKIRHVLTRQALHGFHFKICKTKAFHKAKEGCVCLLCGESANTYHLLSCNKNTMSLTKWATME